MPDPNGDATNESILPGDLINWIHRNFGGQDAADAEVVLAGATLHTGERPSGRQLRAAAVGSHGKLEKLKYLVDLLKIDWRDVIVAGEYEICDKQLVRVRNLDMPIPDGASVCPLNIDGDGCHGG